jgi:2-dehydro-3-deoxyphosphooctonate aldolase (KDO 8-P synthase)
MATHLSIGDIQIGPGKPLAILAGPCVLEDTETNRHIAGFLKGCCQDLGLPLILKGSFDKANRTSMRSHRGPGIEEGLDVMASLKEEFELPLTTDIHTPEQAAPAAKVVDLLQVPAFLCRQTDLLSACAETGRPVNVKKGQFISPAEMTHVLEKLEACKASGCMLTERGTFFGYHRLVNDFTGLGDLMDLGAPVCFDVTHSTQLPGAGTDQTAGRPDRAGLLARAAVAAGVHALFIECHPEPARGRSDASTMQTLEQTGRILQDAAVIHAALQESHASA